MDIFRVTSEDFGEETEEPPHSGKRWTVGVIANVKGKCLLPAGAPEDAEAEFDHESTVNAIQAAIESDGHRAVFLPADATLPTRIQELQPDICFNISEGMGPDGREAQVPGLLELLHIPYTASRIVANAVSLNKAMTKQVWRAHNLPTARFQEFTDACAPIDAELCYPLFVKPAREGTGMGVDDSSLVNNETELRRRVEWMLTVYNQPALVEEYLPGREFTVGVLGRPDAALYGRFPQMYAADGFMRLPILEVDLSRSVTPTSYGHLVKTIPLGAEGAADCVCPARNVSPELVAELQGLAIRAHQAITALDVSRVDFRLDAEGHPHLIEINTLPGLTPGYSDLWMIADAAGLPYRDLILEILYLGASRYGLMNEKISRRSLPAFQREKLRSIAA
jgi:D-alanine-D-alanine ligase-like ATP-grasp enzyme